MAPPKRPWFRFYVEKEAEQMARTYTQLHTSIWSDPDFCSLPSHAQRLYLLASSQANISYAGVVPFTEKRWAAMSSDTTRGEIADAVNVLVGRGYVVLDDDTEELWVRSWVKYNGVFAQPNMRKAMIAAYSAILSTGIRRAFFDSMPDDVKVLLTAPPEVQARPNGGVGEAKRPTDITREVDLDLDLQVEHEQGEATRAGRPQVHDLAAPGCPPSFFDEAPQVVAEFANRHPESTRVDDVVQRLIDEGRRFRWASDLRTALASILPDIGKPSPFDEAQRAQRAMQAAGNAITDALARVAVDPDAQSKIAALRASLVPVKETG